MTQQLCNQNIFGLEHLLLYFLVYNKNESKHKPRVQWQHREWQICQTNSSHPTFLSRFSKLSHTRVCRISITCKIELNSHIFYLVKWTLLNFWVNIFSFDMSIFDHFSFSYFASTYNLKTRLVAFQQNIIHYYTNISICCQIFKWTWFAAGFSTTYTIRSNLLWTSSITRTSLINFFYYMRIRLVLTWVLHKHYWWLLTLWRYIHTRTFLHLS